MPNIEGKRGSRAQSGVELLIILAVGLVVLGFVVSSSQDKLNSSQQVLAFSVAKGSANSLASAADSVYFEGVGAKKQVQFTLPEGVTAVSISTNSINIRVGSNQAASDATALTQATICSSSLLPTKAGTYTISVESTDGCVLLGSNSNFSVSTTLLVVNSYANASTIKSINYTNKGTTPISVNLNLNFSSSAISVVFVNPSDSNFILQANSFKEVQLGITISSTALGSYSESLKAFGNNGVNLTTSIVISVSGQNCQQQTCAPSSSGSNISLIDIKTYSSNSYSQLKDIFDPADTTLITGGNWDHNSVLTLDIRDPTDAYSLSGYPKNITTNSTGGFSDSMLDAGLNGLTGYIVRASGMAGGKSRIQTTNFNVNACT